MKVALLALLAILAALCFTTSSAATNRIVCYYGSWAVYRPGKGKFDVEQIDPNLCTNLIYTFVGLSDDGSVHVLDAWNDLDDNYGKGAIKRFNKLRERNPNVKTSIAMGGWNEGGYRYSQVIGNDNLRANMVKSIVDFVLKYGFDGFDLDWEYPGNSERGGRPVDLANLSKFVKELHEAFQPHGLLLSAAVAAAEQPVSTYYQVPELSKYLDFINVMAYDLHGVWDHAVGQNAPLYPSHLDNNKGLNAKACIEGWIKLGADPAKLVLGMGTYGRSFTLANANNHEIGAAIYGEGEAGPYTRQRGMLGYNEIIELINAGKMVEYWDDESKVPYAWKGDQWVGYDNVKSVTLKCEFAKQMGLAGVMIWSLETDDFQGDSGTKFPLLNAINKAIKG